MEFEQREYLIGGGEQSLFCDWLSDMEKTLCIPSEGVMLADMAEAIGIDGARGVMTEWKRIGDEVSLSITEYDYDCEPCIMNIAVHFGMEVTSVV